MAGYQFCQAQAVVKKLVSTAKIHLSVVNSHKGDSDSLCICAVVLTISLCPIGGTENPTRGPAE